MEFFPHELLDQPALPGVSMDAFARKPFVELTPEQEADIRKDFQDALRAGNITENADGTYTNHDTGETFYSLIQPAESDK